MSRKLYWTLPFRSVPSSPFAYLFIRNQVETRIYIYIYIYNIGALLSLNTHTHTCIIVPIWCVMLHLPVLCMTMACPLCGRDGNSVNNINNCRKARADKALNPCRDARSPCPRVTWRHLPVRVSVAAANWPSSPINGTRCIVRASRQITCSVTILYRDKLPPITHHRSVTQSSHRQRARASHFVLDADDVPPTL